MKTRYDEENAARYRAAKAQAWRERSELFSMLEIVGDVTGLSVVDCACGDGWLTRSRGTQRLRSRLTLTTPLKTPAPQRPSAIAIW
jgi:2-polyprenyl-3-methyl-5-hydroxy-6-metoxy-1,4-benzoquinol methylase